METSLQWKWGSTWDRFKNQVMASRHKVLVGGSPPLLFTRNFRVIFQHCYHKIIAECNAGCFGFVYGDFYTQIRYSIAFVRPFCSHSVDGNSCECHAIRARFAHIILDSGWPNNKAWLTKITTRHFTLSPAKIPATKTALTIWRNCNVVVAMHNTHTNTQTHAYTLVFTKQYVCVCVFGTKSCCHAVQLWSLDLSTRTVSVRRTLRHSLLHTHSHKQ